MKRLAEETSTTYISLADAGIAQLVERNLAKVDVAGSNPVSRSALRGRGHTVIAPDVPKIHFLLKVAPPPPIPPGGGVYFLWRRTQVVRERSAKPLCTGSNPVVASASRFALVSS